MTTIRGMSERAKNGLKKDLAQQRTVSKANRDNTPGELVQMTCVCGTQILVHPPVPGVKRKAVCVDCAQEIIREAKAQQRNVEVIHRPRAKKHTWRTEDGQIHPVTLKERPIVAFNLDTMSDAELGALVRARMLEQREAEVRANMPVVEKMRREQEAQAEAEHKSARKEEQKAERDEKVMAIMAEFDVTKKQAKALLKEYEAAN